MKVRKKDGKNQCECSPISELRVRDVDGSNVKQLSLFGRKKEKGGGIGKRRLIERGWKAT